MSGARNVAAFALLRSVRSPCAALFVSGHGAAVAMATRRNGSRRREEQLFRLVRSELCLSTCVRNQQSAVAFLRSARRLKRLWWKRLGGANRYKNSLEGRVVRTVSSGHCNQISGPLRSFMFCVSWKCVWSAVWHRTASVAQEAKGNRFGFTGRLRTLRCFWRRLHGLGQEGLWCLVDHLGKRADFTGHIELVKTN